MSDIKHASIEPLASVSVAAFRNHLAEHLSRAEFAGQRILITRRGRPVAALVPVDAAGAQVDDDDNNGRQGPDGGGSRHGEDE